jgi:hypothetical protein
VRLRCGAGADWVRNRRGDRRFPAPNAGCEQGLVWGARTESRRAKTESWRDRIIGGQSHGERTESSWKRQLKTPQKQTKPTKICPSKAHALWSGSSRRVTRLQMPHLAQPALIPSFFSSFSSLSSVQMPFLGLWGGTEPYWAASTELKSCGPASKFPASNDPVFTPHDSVPP